MPSVTVWRELRRVTPDQLELFVELVIPELQRRGLFRTDYQYSTLRENLGLPFPINRYTADRSVVQAAE